MHFHTNKQRGKNILLLTKGTNIVVILHITQIYSIFTSMLSFAAFFCQHAFEIFLTIPI